MITIEWALSRGCLVRDILISVRWRLQHHAKILPESDMTFSTLNLMHEIKLLLNLLFFVLTIQTQSNDNQLLENKVEWQPNDDSWVTDVLAEDSSNRFLALNFWSSLLYVHYNRSRRATSLWSPCWNICVLLELLRLKRKFSRSSYQGG